MNDNAKEQYKDVEADPGQTEPVCSYRDLKQVLEVVEQTEGHQNRRIYELEQRVYRFEQIFNGIVENEIQRRLINDQNSANQGQGCEISGTSRLRMQFEKRSRG